MFIELTTDAGSPVLINTDAIVEVQPRLGGEGTWVTVRGRKSYNAIAVAEDYTVVRDIIRKTTKETK